MNISTLLTALATLAWLGLIGVVAMIFVRTSRNQSAKGLTSLVVGLLVAALLLTTVGSGLVFLQADQYAVVRSAFQPNGYRPDALGPGLHWIVPFVEVVPSEYPYSIAVKTYIMSSSSDDGVFQVIYHSH